MILATRNPHKLVELRRLLGERAVEPLPADHPFRTLDNVLCTPHIGYVTRREYEIFYRDTVENIVAWLNAGNVSDIGLLS